MRLPVSKHRLRQTLKHTILNNNIVNLQLELGIGLQAGWSSSCCEQESEDDDLLLPRSHVVNVLTRLLRIREPFITYAPLTEKYRMLFCCQFTRS